MANVAYDKSLIALGYDLPHEEFRLPVSHYADETDTAIPPREAAWRVEGVMMATQSAWRLSGEQVDSCNCAWGCPCQFNSRPTHGTCHAAIGWRIDEGYHRETRLDGLRYALLVSWPGAMHEGNGTAQWFIDERATAVQRAALSSIVSGQTGGTLFQVLAAVCPNTRPVLTARIEIESDRERRVATLRVGDYASTRLGPITNPVTNEEHRARIVLPNGFEYKEAEMANTVSGRVNAGAEPLVFELENSYGQLNAFEYASP